MLTDRIALAAARSSVVETRLPAVAAEPERGQVQVLVFGGIISPVFAGGVELSARACGPSTTSPCRLSAAPQPSNAEIPAAACLSLLASGCRCPQGPAPWRRGRLGHRRWGGDDVPGADAGDRPHPDAV